jgi:hypothetical protein
VTTTRKPLAHSFTGKLLHLRPSDPDSPNVSTTRPTLPPLLRRPNDGLDRQSLNLLAIPVVVYILCAGIDTALVP